MLLSFPVLSLTYPCSCSFITKKASSQKRFGRPEKRLKQLKIDFKHNLINRRTSLRLTCDRQARAVIANRDRQARAVIAAAHCVIVTFFATPNVV